MIENKHIAFTIPIEPKAQMRVRFRRQGNFVRTHKHKTQEFNESILLNALADNAPETPLDGAVTVVITAYMSIPRSKPTWWLVAALEGFLSPTTKPDIDNLAKMLLDCMTSMNYYHDDKQITGLAIAMKYSEKPRWVIDITATPQPASKKDYDKNHRKGKWQCKR